MPWVPLVFGPGVCVKVCVVLRVEAVKRWSPHVNRPAPMASTLCTVCRLLVLASASGLEISLLDRGLAGVAALVAQGMLSTAAEDAAVRRMLQGDEGLLLLAKHFGSMPSFGRLILASLGDQSAPTRQTTTVASSVPSANLFEVLTSRRSVKEYDPSRPIPEASVRSALQAAVLGTQSPIRTPVKMVTPAIISLVLVLTRVCTRPLHETQRQTIF